MCFKCISDIILLPNVLICGASVSLIKILKSDLHDLDVDVTLEENVVSFLPFHHNFLS